MDESQAAWAAACGEWSISGGAERGTGEDGALVLGVEPLSEKPQQQPSQDLSLEEYFIQFVLDNQGNLTETELAKRLGISRKTLWERRNRFGIPRTKKETV